MRTDAFLHTQDPEAIRKIELMSKLIELGKPEIKTIRGRDKMIVDWIAIVDYIEESYTAKS